MHKKLPTIFLAATLLALMTAPAALATGTKAQKSRDMLQDDCRRITARAERAYGIPAQLLSAISMAESGYWYEAEKARIAWPWTVYAEGKGIYHPDRDSAQEAVADLRARGVSNIDVGCMQINLYHHGKAFDDVEQAMDPHRNVDYAARFLRRLHDRHRSWSQAVAHYHSSTVQFNRPYRQKVMKLWHQEQRAFNARRREQAQREYREHRERLRRARLAETQLSER
tara:strand:- start:520 stop:1197 length:678 start_codon:yes stop_codon:yes gene_type:complete